MACVNCSDCADNGCAPIIYPDCILTKIAYPCLGLGAGKTGTEVFAAIEAAICASSDTVVEGCSQEVIIGEGDITTIAVTPVTVGSTTTYTVCLAEDFVTFLQDINDEFAGIIADITALAPCIRCDEVWKVMGAAGNMENGSAIPAVGVAVTTQLVARLRRTGLNHTDLNFTCEVDLGAVGVVVLFTLPANAGTTNYRPTTDLVYQIVANALAGTDQAIGYVIVASATGIVTLTMVPIGASIIDQDYFINFNALIPTD